MLKKENGVSLVALIITILVLLILAAVSLTLVYNVLTSATKDEEEKERNTYRTQLSQSINSIVQDVQDVDTVKTEENANPQEENTDTDKDEEAIANESEVIMQVIQGKYSGDVEEIKNIKSLTDRINDKVASSKITFKGGTSENDPLIIVVNGKSNNFEYKVDYNNYSVLDK